MRGTARGSQIYSRVLHRILEDGLVSDRDSVLVICGGRRDRDELCQAGFTNVTISNIDDAVDDGLHPFTWDRQDAEHLTYANDSFDIAIVYAGLHHCYSPHRALLEMFRVARRAVIVFEARDSFALNVAKRLRLTDDYEIEAVSYDFETGGVGNSPIPNYIYRWTEREVVKTIASFDPMHEPRVRFFYGLRLPYQRFANTQRPILRTMLSIMGPLVEWVAKAFPTQCNEFAFVISKEARLQPWLSVHDGAVRLNEDAIRQMGRVYRPAKNETFPSDPCPVSVPSPSTESHVDGP